MAKVTKKDIQLETRFKYHANREGGGTEEAEAIFISIEAFTMKHIESIAPIKEIVMKAMGGFAKAAEYSASDIEDSQEQASDEPKDAAIIPSKEMMAIIQMHCGEGDLVKLYAHMKELLTSKIPVAYIDGDGCKLNGNNIEKLSFADFENLCGEYIGNFIL